MAATDDNMSRIEALVQGGRHAEAARLLIAAAAAGQPAALGQLAMWRIDGSIVRRDLARARALLADCAAKGDMGSALLHAFFLASGTGGEAQWPAALAALERLGPRVRQAAAQLQLIRAMDIDADGFPARPVPTRPLSASPRALVAERFLSAAECAYLRAVAEPGLQPSVVVDPATRRMVPNPARTSDAAMFGVFGEDLVVNALNRRMAALSGTALAQGEPLQVLRYRPGTEYKPHIDALPAEPNQRILTLLVYLSEDYEGGETHFPRTGLSFRGRAGDALLFRNSDAHGRPDPMALHAGLPVTSGVKYLASRWIRAEPFSYPAPEPLLNL
jgi:prolyl 4-hydroxylase